MRRTSKTSWMLAGVWFSGLDVGMAGCVFALLAMAFAGETVSTVAEAAMAVARGGSQWTRARVLLLIDAMGDLPLCGHGKRDGRASRFMGRFFYAAITKTDEIWDSTTGVFGKLGEQLLASVRPSFFDLLKTAQELPLIGKYFGVRFVRLGALLRENLSLPLIIVGRQEWKLMKAMGEGPVAGFAALGIYSFEDAQEMVFVLRRFLGGSNASKFIRMLSVMDVPCFVCEWSGLLGKVGSASALLCKIPAEKNAQISVHLLDIGTPSTTQPGIQSQRKSKAWRGTRVLTTWVTSLPWLARMQVRWTAVP
jgi:hypothetical protein